MHQEPALDLDLLRALKTVFHEHDAAPETRGAAAERASGRLEALRERLDRTAADGDGSRGDVSPSRLLGSRFHEARPYRAGRGREPRAR